ncbi:GntR family transcriptional regulator [Novosphingobium sediminicola]|uniref:DNA-binding GntR family transcriptional regulator n=1 Tax=Novosphingobium sediminicola TaxID=563162 RepID=A0A7W6G4X8_9SPHN|nr:GntR family transcriptional regulator [Novosphingobium sediminicola]MBB3953698.1 DNA-binding GntR family transcriptional regulator [Novosphingobium sediminicola]
MSTSDKIVPVTPSSGSPDIYQTVLKRIQRGEIKDGERIVDTAIAAEFGVSRMPARQALLLLVHEGYLVGTTRGFALPQLSDQDVAEIFEVRLQLEPRAAGSACPLLEAEHLVALRKAYELAAAAQAAGDTEGLMDANSQFRQVWLDVVPNKRMAASIQRFVDQVLIVRRRTVIDPGAQKLVVELTLDLLYAFERRDGLRVHDLMIGFINEARDIYFASDSAADVDARRGKAKAAGG